MEAMILMNLKNYDELSKLSSFEECFKYLKLDGIVGKETFGFDRYLNQILYKSDRWKHCRRDIIIRDNGCDLGCENFEIYGRILIHHINPITADDIINSNSAVFDPNNLISTSLSTHNAIHYGNSERLINNPIERIKNDTCPWK